VPARPAANPAPPPRGEVTPPSSSRKFFGHFVFILLLLLSAGLGVLGGLVFVYSTNLPQIHSLENYHPDVMTDVYADDGQPIARFALERRVMVTYNQIPAVLRNAVISVEDRHFESHWGVDVLAILRAGIIDIMQWRKTEGASTLTQQLARMLFLSTEKTFRRKFQEILLAIQIERHFTKPQIFTMYSNQVDLGSGNYGFEAASEFFFGKHLRQLTLPEAALLAGLPRSPTYYSPILHPHHALARRNEVLAAMLDNGKITRAQYVQARHAPLGLHIQRWNDNLAPYFVEDVREFLEDKYGAQAVETSGLRVYTTLNVRLQQLATHALRQGLRDYDKRHGWRGAPKNILKHAVRLPGGQVATLQTYLNGDWRRPLRAGQLAHGLVMKVEPAYAEVRFGKLMAHILPADFAWTQVASPPQIFHPGDVDLFRIHKIAGSTVEATLDQTPEVQGALVALDNATGEIKAMVGGYDFATSKFNRAVQAQRQVGSSFKVYVYAQALLDGLSPFDTILDAPVSFQTVSGLWSPHDYDDKFEGQITLLRALAESRNVPAVKLLRQVGIHNVIRLCREFGITSRLVPDLPLALGASALTPLEHASAFTTFPDDGVHIAPRMILRVTDYHGRLLDNFAPQVTDVLPAGVARLETSMLRQVFISGTADRARALAEKYPLAGKTGTTNNWTDAWFIGFSPSLTCGVWVGYDDERSLGPGEEGSHVALPIWMNFMSAALAGRPVEHFPDSPLLTNPEQVQQILASAGPSSLPLGGSATLLNTATSPQPASRTPIPSVTDLPATSRPVSARQPASTVPAAPQPGPGAP
jgi:penicillin-binding protein 1A